MQAGAKRQDPPEHDADRRREEAFQDHGDALTQGATRAIRTPESRRFDREVARAAWWLIRADEAMRSVAASAGRQNRSDEDLRAWCMKLDCTQAELRDTVRAVLRLMAGSGSGRVLH